jgi:hypothetical protein
MMRTAQQAERASARHAEGVQIARHAKCGESQGRGCARVTPEACLLHVTPEACHWHVTPEACHWHDAFEGMP